MLAIPTTGCALSVEKHNVRLDVLADWIEASILFDDDELSATDIVDALCEGNIYRRQDMASERVSDAWTEIRRRSASVDGHVPFVLAPSRITRTSNWTDAPAHSFCVVLSLAKWYRDWASQFGRDYTEQGELFELLTMESLHAQLTGWMIHQTGWTRTHASRLSVVVNDVAGKLGESQGNLMRWTKPDANEAGLDLLCYRPFLDQRVGVPVYLMQCASGGDWEGKLHTPRLEIWTKIVQFAARPRKAFATPFSFLDDDFIINCNLVDGLLLDRYRLLGASMYNANWLPDGLRRRIVRWARPRVRRLPRRAG